MATTISNASAGTAIAKAGTDRARIAGNFDDFLKLLTTQLRNQSPLDPLDTNQFTQQLVQFASVEQQLKTNETLGALLTSAKASTASTAAGFVGRQVVADGATARLASGRALWTINPARDAAQATISIADATGKVVATQTRALTAGSQSLAWDGRGTNGLPLPEGDYTLAVSARDAGGAAVAVSSEIRGRVDSIDLAGSEPVLLVGTARVALGKIKSVGAGGA